MSIQLLFSLNFSARFHTNVCLIDRTVSGDIAPVTWPFFSQIFQKQSLQMQRKMLAHGLQRVSSKTICTWFWLNSVWLHHNKAKNGYKNWKGCSCHCRHRIEDSPSVVGFERRTYPFFYYLQCTWKSMNKVHSQSNTYFHWLPNLKSINFGHKFTMWWFLLLYRLTLSYEIISGLKQ